VIGPAGHADAGAFLVRLLRLDSCAVVRLRPARPQSAPHEISPQQATSQQPSVQRVPEPAAEIWAMLPFGVLAVRALPVSLDTDVTVPAAALLETLRDPSAARPQRRDEAWHWSLPPSPGRVVERIPAEDVARVAAAASRTLREASRNGVGGHAVGERKIRDALLDHIPIIVTGYDGQRVDVPQRIVQAVVRMGFLGSGSVESESVTFGDNLVTVRLAAGWIGLDGSYGCAWYRPSSPMRMT
jgi:hypothetical protein